MVAARDRYDGFRAELDAQGLAEAAVVHADFSVAGGRAAMFTLLDRAPDTDGVFVANDLMALGALQAAAERGRRVPDDLAVIGFDDIPLAATSAPPLTTVRQPMAEMGRALAGRLLDLVGGGDPPEPLIVPTEIVLRSTV